MDVALRVNEEQAAYCFAATLLMPTTALWAATAKHRTAIGRGELFALKPLFGVSVQAVTYRCKELGIFREALCRRLFTDFTRFGWRRPPYEEPYAMKKGEVSQRCERLTFRALAEGAVSKAKAAELLGVSGRELNRRMEQPPDFTADATGEG